VTGSRPDAEADEGVKLIWSKDGGALLRGEDEAEAVEEAKRAVQRGLNHWLLKGWSTYRGTEHRMAGMAAGHRGTLTSEDGKWPGIWVKARVAKDVSDTTEGGSDGRSAGWVGEGWAVDGTLARGKGKANGPEAARWRREGRGGRRWWWVASSNGGEDLSDDWRGSKDVDVICVSNHNSTVSDDRLDGTEHGVEAEGEELGPQGISLACPTAGEDDLRWASIAPDVELGGCTIAWVDPSPQPWEALSNDRHESTAVDRVEGVSNVSRNVNPIWVLIKCGTDGVSNKLHPWAAGNPHLDRPWRTAGLDGWGGGARRRRLEVGGKAPAVLVGSNHGDGTSNRGPDGNGSELSLWDITIRNVAVLA
jgi:hypothetical protein